VLYIRVALAQMRCEKGDFEGNLRHAEEFAAQARDAGCDVLVLPEMSLSGYCTAASFPDVPQPLDTPWLDRLAALTLKYGLAISAGLVEANPGSKPYITQVLAQDGRITGVYRKVNANGDEAPYYTPGTETPVFTLRTSRGDVTCALAVCADSDRPDLFAEWAHKGAKVILHSSAPGLYTRRTGEASWQAGYDWYKSYLEPTLPNYAREHRMPIVVATQCGATVDEDFPGGSFVFDANGECVAQTPDYHEALLVHDIEIED
jgi:predicted amidohydrolase